MSETTNLKLFKYNTNVDGEQFFSIKDALNNNWDKLDEVIGSFPEDTTLTDQINGIKEKLINSSKTNLGFVKIGDNINVDENGVISINAEDLGINENAVKEIIETVVPSMISDQSKTFTLGQILTFLDPVGVNNPDFNKMTLLDGKVISDYAGLYQNFIDSYIVPLYESNPNRFVSEEEWQNIKDQHGCCGYYVYDPETGYCRIPLLNGMITGTTELDGGELNNGGIPKDFGDLMKTKIYTVEEDSLPNFVTKIKNAIQVTGEIEEEGSTPKPVNITTMVDPDKIIDSFSSIDIWKFKDANGKQQSDYENEVEIKKLIYETALQNISSSDQTVQNTITDIVTRKNAKNNEISSLEAEIGEIKVIDYVVKANETKEFIAKTGYIFSSGTAQAHKNSGEITFEYYDSNDSNVYVERIQNDSSSKTLYIQNDVTKIIVTCVNTAVSLSLEESPIPDTEHPSLLDQIENKKAEISTKQVDIENIKDEIEPLNIEKDVLEKRLEELDESEELNEENVEPSEDDPYPYYTREAIETRLSVIDELLNGSNGLQIQLNNQTEALNLLIHDLTRLETTLNSKKMALDLAKVANNLIDVEVADLLENNINLINNGQQLKEALEDYNQAQRDLKDYTERFTFDYYGNSDILEAQATKVYFYLVVANKFESDTQLNLNNITDKMDKILDALVNNIINKDSSEDTESESGFLVTKGGIVFQWGKTHVSSEDGICSINFQCQFINDKYSFFINPQIINEDYVYNEIEKSTMSITIQTNLTQLYWVAFGIADPSETDETEDENTENSIENSTEEP